MLCIVSMRELVLIQRKNRREDVTQFSVRRVRLPFVNHDAILQEKHSAARTLYRFNI